jgi:Fe-S-cluster-containing dehydrogenase component
MKAFVIDVGICNGCYNCQIACKDEHVGNDWTPYAKPEPETGQFWLRLNEEVRGSVPRVRVAYRPVLCMHCDNAPCITSCPVEGAIYKRDDGLVVIDPVKCDGCRNCVDACPYDVIFFNDGLNIAQKCTGCAHLIDGGWEAPRCADACPTQAIKFGEEAELAGLIEKAEVIGPELGCQPRVYYLNLPKRFIGGTVYDPVEKEVIIGATCDLRGADGSAWTATTDGFGDFMFDGLPVGEYSLSITKNGSAMELPVISTEKDVNLGDIPFP